MIAMIPDVWKMSVRERGYFHFHFVKVFTYEEYMIAWTELHKAHIAYTKKLKALEKKRLLVSRKYN